jgi:hypothetical protein
MFSQIRANSFVNENASSTPLAPAMAKRTASQAAEVTKEYTITPVDEFDISKLEVVIRGEKKDGSKTVLCLYNKEKLVLMMTPGKNWSNMLYRVQTPFGGTDPAATYEAYSTSIAADSQIISVLQQIDAKVIEACKQQVDPDCSKFWQYSAKPREAPEMFCPKLVLRAANEDQLTACKVRSIGQKGLVDARGKEQLDALLTANSWFTGAKVKYAVSLHNVWVQKDALGITWRLTNLVVDCKEVQPPVRRVIGDCFADVTFSDEDENE